MALWKRESGFFVVCYLLFAGTASIVMNKESAPALQIAVSFNKPGNVQTLYKER